MKRLGNFLFGALLAGGLAGLLFFIGALAALFLGAPADAVTLNGPLVLPLLQNGDQQAVGVIAPGQQVIPIVTVPPSPFPPPVQPIYAVPPLPPVPPFVATPATIVTDGFKPVSIAPPYKGAAASQNSLAVSISPNPNYQCPITSAINTTANVTQITNPGGKRIFVCNVVVINGGTAQSVTLLEGTGTACATNPVYWLGGSGGTAALAVNGGFSLMGVNYAMQTAGNNVCVLISGSTNVSGSLTYGVY